MIDISKIKELRNKTGISLGKCKEALEEAGGDLEKAGKVLQRKGIKTAAKKRNRDTGAGIVQSYIHNNKRVGALLDLRCETDFVAKNKEFQKMGHEICMHVAAMQPEDKEELLESHWIKDDSKKIKDLIAEYIAKLGENIVIKRFISYKA